MCQRLSISAPFFFCSGFRCRCATCAGVGKTSKRLVRLSKEAEKDGAYRVARRLRAVVLNSQGHTSGELANLLQAPRSKVSAWLQRYQSQGIEGCWKATGRAVPPN